MPTGPRPYTLRACQILFVHSLNDQPCVCGIDFIGPLGWQRPEMVNVLETAAVAWGTVVVTELPFNLTYVRAEARGLRGPNDFVAEYSLDPPQPGDVADPAKDGQQAIVISKRTAVAGRSGRGRLFLPGLPNGALANGLIIASFRNNLAAAVQGVASAVVAQHQGWLPVVISYETNDTWRPQPLTFEITSFESRTAYPGSMNKRRPD